MKPIWTRDLSVELLTTLHVGTAARHLGIEFLEVGADVIRARMPVDERTRQPAGILHGGVSVLLAETLGSCGAAFSSPVGHWVVGLDINACHNLLALEVAGLPGAALYPGSWSEWCAWPDGPIATGDA